MSLVRRIGGWLKAAFAVLGALVWHRLAGPASGRGEEEEGEQTLERRSGAQPRATAIVAGLLIVAAAGFSAFALLYALEPDTQLLGVCIGGAVVLVGIALAVAGKAVVPQEQAEGPYHDYGDAEEQRQLTETAADAGEGISRRRLLVVAGGAAAAAGGVAALAPLTSLGPSPGRKLFATPWSAGRRVVGTGYEPILAEEIGEAIMLTGFPEGAERDSFGAPLIIVRLPPDELDLDPERLAGAPEGILAFSRICPHAGCAVSMYRHPKLEANQPGPALVCPCHYSTFDPATGGTLEFGPAGRDLPQLPLQINAAGELEAKGDFFDPVGPSWGGVRSGPDPGEAESS